MLRLLEAVELKQSPDGFDQTGKNNKIADIYNLVIMGFSTVIAGFSTIIAGLTRNPLKCYPQTKIQNQQQSQQGKFGRIRRSIIKYQCRNKNATGKKKYESVC